MDKEYIEDFNDRVINYRFPSSTGYDFSGFWILSTMFSKWRKERKAKKQKQKNLDSETVIIIPERKVDTVSI